MEIKQLQELQQVNLEIAKYFVDFCQKNNLLCYFCGGGCIGTIRHQGFIPWDDDLDFFMPREDYEKLATLWEQYADKDHYPLLRASIDYNDHNSFTTIRDAKTTFIKPYQVDLDIPHGIMIDVFPIDGAPVGKFQQKIQKMWALVYALFCSQVVPERHGGIIAKASTFLLKLFKNDKIRYKIWRFAQKKMTKYSFGSTPYVTELCVGPRYMGNIYSLKDFESAIFLPFEDTKMPVPVGYDNYLKQVFGDYLKLPSTEEQTPHHDAVYMNTKESYKKYRGKYYKMNKEIS